MANLISDSQREMMKAQYAAIIDEACNQANEGAALTEQPDGQGAGEYRLRQAVNTSMGLISTAFVAVELFRRAEDKKDID